ncbi:hypothetical protein [Virgibacillus kimchii]
MNDFTAMNEKIGTSKMDLYFMKKLHLLSFKKIAWFEKQISRIYADMETLKNKTVY